MEQRKAALNSPYGEAGGKAGACTFVEKDVQESLKRKRVYQIHLTDTFAKKQRIGFSCIPFDLFKYI